MLGEPGDLFCPTRVGLSTHCAQKSNYQSSTTKNPNKTMNTRFISVQFLRITHMLYVVIGLLALSSTALAQFNSVEPALPGSVEYWLTTNNCTWVRTSDTITVGSYVEDLMSGWRLDQPEGRGKVGIVTEIDWDPAPYNEWAAMVDFGRNFSVGLVFSELSAIQIVPIPEPSSLLVLLSGVLLTRAVLSRPRRAKANS
jgi:hypothetical protein